MPNIKGTGNGKGSPQKTAAARRVHTQSTKSKKQAQIEEIQIDTLATISSPVGPKPSLKKLTLVSESTTSLKKKALPSANSPGSESGIVDLIVTATEKKEPQNESSEDESSTRNEETRKEEESQHRSS